MSVILDALKKLEREKIEQRKRRLDFGEEIAAGAVRSPAVKSAWKIWFTAGVVALLTAVATVYATVSFLGEKPRHVSVAERKQNPPFLDTNLVQRREEQHAVAEPGPASKPEASASRGTVPVEVHASPASAPSSARKDDAATSAGTFPGLKVSGIAWNESRADRRAVVNGALVGEGAVVQGATLEKIFVDRVRFSSSGRVFEIHVGDGN